MHRFDANAVVLIGALRHSTIYFLIILMAIFTFSMFLLLPPTIVSVEMEYISFDPFYFTTVKLVQIPCLAKKLTVILRTKFVCSSICSAPKLSLNYLKLRWMALYWFYLILVIDITYQSNTILFLEDTVQEYWQKFVNINWCLWPYQVLCGWVNLLMKLITYPMSWSAQGSLRSWINGCLKFYNKSAQCFNSESLPN